MYLSLGCLVKYLKGTLRRAPGQVGFDRIWLLFLPVFEKSVFDSLIFKQPYKAEIPTHLLYF